MQAIPVPKVPYSRLGMGFCDLGERMKELLLKIKSIIIMSQTRRDCIVKFEQLLEENKELLKENGIEL